MRVEECPHRILTATEDGHETVSCGLLNQLIGAEPESLYRVERDACEACCRESGSSEKQITPVIASLLFSASQAIVDARGVRGCAPDEAARLQRWAEAALLRDAKRVKSPLGRHRVDRPCYYLGAHLEEPKGVFECHHANHECATFSDCQTCPDWLPRLDDRRDSERRSTASTRAQEERPAYECAVAVFADRTESAMLEWCVDSLIREGWCPHRIFIQPGVVIPARFSDITVTQSTDTATKASRFRMAGAEMYLRMPDAKYFAFIHCGQIMVDGNRARRQLSGDAEMAHSFSLSAPDGTPAWPVSKSGWHDADLGESFPQLGLVWSNALLREFLCDPTGVDVDAIHGWSALAETLATWSANRGASPRYARPALVSPLVASARSTPHSLLKSSQLDVRCSMVEPSDVAIIVPAWNCAAYLPRCIESLQRQTVRAKVVVVDDASTDATPEILHAYGTSITSIRHSHRRGANAARNSGLRSTSCPFIAFADADNEYAEDWLGSLLRRIVSSDRTGVAFCGYTKQHLNGTLFRVQGTAWDVRRLWCNNYVDMSSVVRRSALPAAGLREGFEPFDDWQLWLDLVARGWVGACETKCLFLRNVRPDGKTLSSKAQPENRAALAAQIRRQYARLVKLGDPIAVVIPAHGCEDLTRECLTHLARYCGVPFQVFYVDNGSPAETVRCIDTHAEQEGIALTTLRWNRNRGFTAAVNWGIRESAPADVLLLNNDCFVAPECIEGLALNMTINERVAACGPLTGDHGGQSLRDSRWQSMLGCGALSLEELNDSFAVAALLPPNPSSCEKDILSFFCALLDRTALGRVGALDERFYSGLGADDEWCVRARARGWKTIVSLSSFARHVHHETFRRLNLDHAVMLRDSKALLHQMTGRLP